MDFANNQADLECLVNIAANISEIMGISVGGSLVLTAWLPAACGLKGYWWKFLAVSFVLILLGLADPGIANLLESLNSPFRLYIALIAGLSILLIQITLAAVGFLSPILITVRERLNRKGLITAINLGALIFPPCWIVALVLCGMEMKNKVQTGPLDQP